jgi:hypothetical protein
VAVDGSVFTEDHHVRFLMGVIDLRLGCDSFMATWKKGGAASGRVEFIVLLTFVIRKKGKIQD